MVDVGCGMRCDGSMAAHAMPMRHVHHAMAADITPA